MTPLFIHFLSNPVDSRLSPKAILIEKKILFRMVIVSTNNPRQPTFKIIPFPKKMIFQRKFMVFLKIFFAQKKEKKKLHRILPTKFI